MIGRKKEVSLDEMIVELPMVRKRNGRFDHFNRMKIYHAVVKAAAAVADRQGKKLDEQEAEKVTDEIIKNIYNKKKYGIFPHSQTNIPDIEDIHSTAIETLRATGHNTTADAYKSYKEQRNSDRNRIVVAKERQGASITDKALFVVSESKEEVLPWDEKAIAFSLMKESGMPEAQSYSVAKEAFRRVVGWAAMRNGNGTVKVKTAKVREFVNEVMEDLGLEGKLRDTNMLSMPVYDFTALLTGKNKENANVVANNPEAVAANVAEGIIKQYMLSNVFSPDVAEAHLRGQIHLHDLGYGPRVYCSSHSLTNIAKWGLILDNLNVKSKPANHAHTLTGHLNTFLASMQAYYAGALGVAYINNVYAPYLDSDLEDMRNNKNEFLKRVGKEMDEGLEQMIKNGANEQDVAKFKINKDEIFGRISKTEVLTDSEIDDFFLQEAQYLIFSGSQNAFSRGSQTLFLDFNIHTGTPHHIKEDPAIGKGGKYHLKQNGKLVALEEKIRIEDEHHLSELYLGDRKVMDEHMVVRNGKTTLVREYSLLEGEKIDTLGDHEKTAQRFARALLKVWGGGLFPFPKCDFHIDTDTFKEQSQKDLLDYACEVASKNGATYFVFDRAATTLSACCRLRTTIEDDYMIKHLESLRFCGVQNVTLNMPQAAYRAGKGNREEFILNMKEGIELVIKAHQQKKDFIRSIGGPGGAQHQTQKPWMDGKPYVNLDDSTYIIGLLGANDAYQYMFGKEFHEDSAMQEMAIEDLAELYGYIKKRSKETGLKLSFEESPAESTSGRMAKLDLKYFNKEASEVVKGNPAEDEAYYTNSVHLRANANVSLSYRIDAQSRFHQIIESGAIIHAFTGEQRPPASSIYNLVEQTWLKTQAAQLTISPEFTECNDCKTISPGYKINKK
jgi:anaerobic ribonucleoside-triphosphate reductase